LVSPRRIAARIPSRWRRIVRASFMNCFEPGSVGPGQPRVEVRGREAWIVELVEQPELFFEQEGAVERLVGLLDLAEL